MTPQVSATRTRPRPIRWIFRRALSPSQPNARLTRSRSNNEKAILVGGGGRRDPPGRVMNPSALCQPLSLALSPTAWIRHSETRTLPQGATPRNWPSSGGTGRGLRAREMWTSPRLGADGRDAAGRWTAETSRLWRVRRGGKVGAKRHRAKLKLWAQRAARIRWNRVRAARG